MTHPRRQAVIFCVLTPCQEPLKLEQRSKLEQESEKP